MDRCPKDEPTGKNLVCKKSSSISEKNWKNLLGGDIHPPPPPVGHRMVKCCSHCQAKDTFSASLEQHVNFSKLLELTLFKLGYFGKI